MSVLDDVIVAMIDQRIDERVRREALLDEPTTPDDAELRERAQRAAARLRARRRGAR